jgi:molybdopterin-guanine dinucleotide biosynthesis protein A
MYHAGMEQVTAFVLAGGKSSRMGEDKAFLLLKGRTLLDRALDVVRTLTPEALIVGERSRFSSFGTVVEDVFRDRGPLAGIHAALTASATDLNLVLALDMPFVEKSFLRYLVREAAATDAIVTVPRTASGWQPLCAVYRKAFAAVAERSLLQGRNKIDALFSDLKVFVVEEKDLVRRGFSDTMFHNVNTRRDLDHARRRRSKTLGK